jgi:hypothetical protein
MSPILRRVLTVFVFILSAAVLMLSTVTTRQSQGVQWDCKVAPQLPPAEETSFLRSTLTGSGRNVRSYRQRSVCDLFVEDRNRRRSRRLEQSFRL